MSWQKERYHNDEEFRLREICQARKYQKTKKGKLAMKKSYENSKKSGYQKKWRKKNPYYHSDYMKEKRMNAREQGICTACFKKNVQKGFKICVVCRK